MRFSKKTGKRIASIILAALIVSSIGLIGYEQSSTSLRIEHSLDTDRIFVSGSNADPELATVQLRLDTPRRNQQGVADVMLVIDRSASFPVDTAVANAKRIIDRLGDNDRVGVVSFATEATLDYPLTDLSNADAVKDRLDELLDEGKTAMGEGMALATDELIFTGRENVEWIQILLTDGRSNFGRDPLEQADNAADEGVYIYTVGVGGSVNTGLLQEVAERTGGRFFTAYSDSIVDQILRLETNNNLPAAREIEITATLTEAFQFEETDEIENRPTQTFENQDGTTTLRWIINELERDDSWIAEYQISSEEIDDFQRVHEFPTEIRYIDSRGRTIIEDLPELRLSVRPRPAAITVSFEMDISDRPSTFDEIQFTDTTSVAEDGEIVEWHWDFGDGGTSDEQNPTHQYNEDGSYEIELTVTSDEGARKSTTREIEVATPAVSVRRSIDTFLPIQETILGQRLEVKLHIRVNERVRGFGINEDFPEGWDIDCSVRQSGFDVSYVNSSAQAPQPEFLGEHLQWLFPSELQAGTELLLEYDVIIQSSFNPEAKVGQCAEEDETGTGDDGGEGGNGSGTTSGSNVIATPSGRLLSISGTIFSATPKLDQMSALIIGDSDIRVEKGFDIKIVVAHWDVETSMLDLKKYRDNQGHKISDDQLQRARTWWLDNTAIPESTMSNGVDQRIDFEMMNCLTAYHLAQVSVFETLPDSNCP